MELYDLIDKFSRLPRSQRLMAIGGMYALFVLLIWFGLIAPKQSQLASLESVYTELMQKKNDVEIRANQKDRREAEFEELSTAFTTARRELPNGDEIAELLSGLSQIGRQVGLEMRQFVRNPERAEEYYAEIPVELEVRGTYHEVAMFFDKLSKLPRIVYVRDLELTPFEEKDKEADSEETELTGSGVLTTFRYLSDEEIKLREEAESNKKGKKRRKK